MRERPLALSRYRDVEVVWGFKFIAPKPTFPLHINSADARRFRAIPVVYLVGPIKCFERPGT